MNPDDMPVDLAAERVNRAMVESVTPPLDPDVDWEIIHHPKPRANGVFPVTALEAVLSKMTDEEWWEFRRTAGRVAVAYPRPKPRSTLPNPNSHEVVAERLRLLREHQDDPPEPPATPQPPPKKREPSPQEQKVAERIALLMASEPTQCTGTTSRGTRCKLDAAGLDGRCLLHR